MRSPVPLYGGELVEQGIHIVDLARWFLGDFTEVDGFAHTYFWDQPVDDNGFLLLKTARNQVAFMHCSCTEWKNTFSFEIYGKVGYGYWDGRVFRGAVSSTRSS